MPCVVTDSFYNHFLGEGVNKMKRFAIDAQTTLRTAAAWYTCSACDWTCPDWEDWQVA